MVRSIHDRFGLRWFRTVCVSKKNCRKFLSMIHVFCGKALVSRHCCWEVLNNTWGNLSFKADCYDENQLIAQLIDERCLKLILIIFLFA